MSAVVLRLTASGVFSCRELSAVGRRPSSSSRPSCHAAPGVSSAAVVRNPRNFRGRAGAGAGMRAGAAAVGRPGAGAGAGAGASAAAVAGTGNRGRFGGKYSPGRPEDGNQPGRSQKPTGKRHNAERRNHRKEKDLGTTEGRYAVYEETSRVTFWGRSFSSTGERSCVVKNNSHRSIRGRCADTRASRWAGDGRRTVSARR